MAFYQLLRKQKVNSTKEQLWDFISSPKNLKSISPSYVGFEITSPHLPKEIYEGMIVSYKFKTKQGIKMNWVTEITHCKKYEFLVDEQRVGPFKMWHHQHILTQLEHGVLMEDVVTYTIPLGILGAIANRLFVRKDLEEIFDHRAKAVDEKFGKLNV